MSNPIRMLDLLSSLNGAELNDFQRFIVSPYFHKAAVPDGLETLLTQVIHHLNQHSDSKVFDREAVYQIVFPGQPFVDKKLEKMLSLLHQLLRRFIAIRYFEQSGDDNDIALQQLRYFQERGLTSRFEALADEMSTKLSNTTPETVEHFRQRSLLEYEISKFEHSFKPGKAPHTSIPGTVEALEAHHLLIKLELFNQYLLAQKRVLFQLPEEFNDILTHSYFPPKLLAKHPLLLLTHRIFLLLQKDVPEIADFEEAQQLFKTHEHLIPLAFAQIYLTYLRSLCALLVNNNHTQLLYTLFELSKEHYDRGYMFMESGEIWHNNLLATSNVALRAGALDWCEHFLEENKNRVFNDPPAGDHYRLCKANLLFYQGQYEQALDFIPQSMASLDFLLFARRLELKCYYELKSDLLEYKIDAFKMYLSRASKSLISTSIRERNGNFVNMLTQLNNSLFDDDSRAQKLLARIDSKDNITDREWLMEKVRSVR